IESPNPKQQLVHVHPDALEIGKVYQPALGIVSGMSEFMQALSGYEELSPRPQWSDWAKNAHQEYVAHSQPGEESGPGLDLARVIQILGETLPQDAIVCNGAGNYTAWLHRYFTYRRY